MPKYIVTVDEVHTCVYSVIAKDPERAVEKVRMGDDCVYQIEEENQGPIDNAEWWVSQRDKDDGDSIKEWKMTEHGDILWQSQ